MEKLSQEVIDMMTPDTVHMMYCSNNWETILLGKEKPYITVDQFDDMWARYFDIWGNADNPVRDTEDFNNRLISFSLSLSSIASQVFDLKQFLKEYVSDNDIVEYGVKLAEEGMAKEKPTEKTFVNFRESLIEKHKAWDKSN